MRMAWVDHPQARQFIAGARDIVPLIVGIVPFAMLTGIAGIKVGIPPGTALALSWLIYAGASQLVAYQLMATDAPVIMILLSTLIVNLRFMMYSAALAPHFEKLSVWVRALYAHIMTDQSFALSLAHWSREGSPVDRPATHWYFFGAALSMILTWQMGVLVGIVLGATIPPEWGLEFSIPLSFLALMSPAIKDRPAASAALASAVCAALTGWLPYRIGLVLSALVGIGVGLAAEHMQMPRPQVQRAPAPPRQEDVPS